jgi:nucleoside phosphorylase
MKACRRFFRLTIALFFLMQTVKADTIAFFYALDKDLEAFKSRAGAVGQPLKVGGHVIPVFQLASHRVYAVKMGSGAVTTASSVQALLARIECDEAFSVGPAGAIVDNLAVGSWHRVTQIICYQKGSWSRAGFQIADSSVLNLKTAETNSNMLPKLFQTVETIKVASGEIFVASDNFRSQLHDQTGADAVDMNLFGLATICQEHHLPLTCWRVTSDRADDHASEDFQSFVAHYDGAGGQAIAELIMHHPTNPNSPDAYPYLLKMLSGQKN